MKIRLPGRNRIRTDAHGIHHANGWSEWTSTAKQEALFPSSLTDGCQTRAQGFSPGLPGVVPHAGESSGIKEINF